MQAPYPMQDVELLQGAKSGTSVQECRNYESFDIFAPVLRVFSVRRAHQKSPTKASSALGWGVAVTYLDSRRRRASVQTD